MNNREKIILDMNNDYIKAVIKLFNQFFIEEATGMMNADLRLQHNIVALQKIYRDERLALRDEKNRFGKWDSSNVDLKFIID